MYGGGCQCSAQQCDTGVTAASDTGAGTGTEKNKTPVPPRSRPHCTLRPYQPERADVITFVGLGCCVDGVCYRGHIESGGSRRRLTYFVCEGSNKRCMRTG